MRSGRNLEGKSSLNRDAILRSGDTERLARLAPSAQLAVWTQAVDNRLHLWWAGRILASGAAIDPTLRQEARAALASATVLAELQQRELAAVVGRLADRSIPALLLKGAAWAYTVYPSPVVRPRLDTDILIREADLAAAETALESLGYAPAVESRRPLTSPQRHYARTGDTGVRHAVDLHWRATTPLAFAHALLFEDLRARSVSIRPVPGARGLGPIDSLLHACLHRLAHHGDHPDLLWLLDIDLLARCLEGEAWTAFVADADRQGLRGVSAIGLARARAAFGTPVPAFAIAALEREPRQMPESAFLAESLSPLAVLRSDLRWACGWRMRAVLLRDHLLPSPDYMRARYRIRTPALLPVAYAWRLVRGVPAWIAGWRRSAHG